MTVSRGVLSGEKDKRSSVLGFGRAVAEQLGFLTRSSSSEKTHFLERMEVPLKRFDLCVGEKPNIVIFCPLMIFPLFI